MMWVWRHIAKCLMLQKWHTKFKSQFVGLYYQRHKENVAFYSLSIIHPSIVNSFFLYCALGAHFTWESTVSNKNPVIWQIRCEIERAQAESSPSSTGSGTAWDPPSDISASSWWQTDTIWRRGTGQMCCDWRRRADMLTGVAVQCDSSGSGVCGPSSTWRVERQMAAGCCMSATDPVGYNDRYCRLKSLTHLPTVFAEILASSDGGLSFSTMIKLFNSLTCIAMPEFGRKWMK